MVHSYSVSGAIGIVLVVSGSILGWYYFPYMVTKKITENEIILDRSDQYRRFINTPQPLKFKVYFFNLSNPMEVQQGDLPVVNEIGPYIYKQYKSKKIKEFSYDGTKIVYTQQTKFVFDDIGSLPLREDDKVTILSVHMNTFLQVFEKGVKDIFKNLHNKFGKTINKAPGVRLVRRMFERIRGTRKRFLEPSENDPGFSLIMSQLNNNIKYIFNNPNSMFLSTTVKKLLFDGVKFCIKPSGLAKAICKQIKYQGQKTIRSLDDGSLAFSLFEHRNGSSEEIYEAHTGKNDISKLGEIQKIDDQSSLRVWLNNSKGDLSICNMINGTDGSFYPPFGKNREPLFIYNSEICRSVEMFYEKNIKYKGIIGLRYSLGDNFLNNIGPEYHNDCFCVNQIVNVIKRKNGCLYPGALDLSQCLGAPIVITLPHMLGTSTEYSSLITGLNPELNKHKTFVDIQEISGIPLRGKKRIQFNMFLKSINNIKLTSNVTTVLMPILWVEEGISLNTENVNQIKTKIINVLATLKIIHWGLVTLGGILIILSIVLYSTSNRIHPKN